MEAPSGGRSKALHSKAFDASTTILEVGYVLVASLKNHITNPSNKDRELDVIPVFKWSPWTCFPILLAFSTDLKRCEILLGDAFQLLAEQLATRMKKPLYLSHCFYSPPTALNQEYDKHWAVLTSFVADSIERGRIAASPVSSDTLTEIIKVTSDSNEKLRIDPECNNETLSDVVLSVLFAGHDTTSIALSHALYLVTTHPKVQDLYLQEVRRVGSLTKSDGMVYVIA